MSSSSSSSSSCGPHTPDAHPTLTTSSGLPSLPIANDYLALLAIPNALGLSPPSSDCQLSTPDGVSEWMAACTMQDPCFAQRQSPCELLRAVDPSQSLDRPSLAASQMGSSASYEPRAILPRSQTAPAFPTAPAATTPAWEGLQFDPDKLPGHFPLSGRSESLHSPSMKPLWTDSRQDPTSLLPTPPPSTRATQPIALAPPPVKMHAPTPSPTKPSPTHRQRLSRLEEEARRGRSQDLRLLWKSDLSARQKDEIRDFFVWRTGEALPEFPLAEAQVARSRERWQGWSRMIEQAGM